MIGIFIDIETTGLDPCRHRIVEIALKVYDLTSGAYLGEFERIIAHSSETWKESDPDSLKVNGFTLEDSQRGETEEIVAQDLIAFLNGYDAKRGRALFIGQNSSFDRGFFSQLIPVYKQEELGWPYHWLDLASMFWAVCSLEGALPLKEQALSKNQIAAHYHLPNESSPHRAMNGVNHLIQCYSAALKRHMRLPSPLKRKEKVNEGTLSRNHGHY